MRRFQHKGKARAGHKIGRERSAPCLTSRNAEFDVDLDMPQNPPVTDEELAILETYLRDIIAQILRDEAVEELAA